MWVKLAKYCELTGDTFDAIHAKRKRGIWLDGRECKIAGDGKLWIDLEAVDRWVQASSPASKSGEVKTKVPSELSSTGAE